MDKLNYQINSQELPQTLSPRTQVNKVVLCLNKHHVSTKKELIKELKTIVEEVFLNESAFKNFSQEECLSLFYKGTEEYFKNVVMLKFDVTKSVSRELFKQCLEEVQIPVFHLRPPVPQIDTEPVSPTGLGAMTPLHQSALKDMKSIGENYDRLQEAKKTLFDRSDALLKLVKTQSTVTVPKVILGAGDMGTTLWLEKYKESHKTSDAQISNESLPDVLMVANDTGKWKNNYTLAQTHHTLGREPGASSASDFVQTSSHQQNRYVNARHLYQSNLINLATTEAPVLFGSSVSAIEKKENHENDWERQDDPYRLQVTLPDKTVKYVYTKEVEVAAGFGGPRDIFPSNYIDKELYQHLSTFDQQKRYTPIVNGNTFMLATQEDETTSPRTIVVYGGGGNATACYGKACFGKDVRSDFDYTNPVNSYSQSHPNRTVLWFSRNGFETAGVGTLAKQAIDHAKEQHTIYPGALHRVEYNNKTKKLIIYMEMIKGTYEKKQIVPRKEDLDAHPVKVFWEFDSNKNRYIQKKCLGFECDQFVSSVGQDNTKLQQATAELGPLKLRHNKKGITTGVASQDGRIRFFGAAASSLDNANLLPYNSTTRRWIQQENICADAEWPGVMPPSRTQVRLEAFDHTNQAPEHVHAMLDDIHLCRVFLQEAGAINEEFLKELVSIRKNNQRRCFSP